MWTQDQIERDLPVIRRLPGVESASIEAGSLLHLRTKTWMLKHRLSLIPLPRFDILIPQDVWDDPRIKYVIPIADFFHWHPTMGLKIGLNSYKVPCWGTARIDIRAATRSPLESALTMMATLQSIRADSAEEFVLPWLIVGLGFMLLALIVSPILVSFIIH